MHFVHDIAITFDDDDHARGRSSFEAIGDIGGLALVAAGLRPGGGNRRLLLEAATVGSQERESSEPSDRGRPSGPTRDREKNLARSGEQPVRRQSSE